MTERPLATARSTMRRASLCRLALLVCLLSALAGGAGEVTAQEQPNAPSSLGSQTSSRRDDDSSGGLVDQMADNLSGGPQEWTKPQKLTSSIQVLLLLTVLSLAPSLLIMTTSFVRVIVVLGLLRQALGTQQLPPSQVITTLALFVTLLVMTPVWKQVYDDSVKPYSEGQIALDEAWSRGVQPIRRFMAMQIERTDNSDNVWLFMQYVPGAAEPETYDDVPLQVLLPAFMLSELKTAFLIGFQVYLPFVILDMVISSVMISMGMLMLPPVLISLPFKLLLFVLVDGWRLVVTMLIESFAPFT